MNKDLLPLVSGEVLDDEIELTLSELCRACNIQAEQVLELFEQGLLEPQPGDANSWRFTGIIVRRVKRAAKLQRDLEVNWAGAALALELIDELDRLREQLRRLE